MEIGLECLASVMGIGKKRLARARLGQLDMRFSDVGKQIRLAPKQASVDKFLFDLHASVAETLPTESLGIRLGISMFLFL